MKGSLLGWWRQHKGVRVSVLFVLWVFFTGTAALYSKAFLKRVPLPFTLTMAQGAIGMVFNYLFLLVTQGAVHPLKGYIVDVFIVLVTHLVGTAMTNVATVKVEASFVNTLKAAEPLCAAVLAKYVLHQETTPLTYFSLIVIVVGVILACTTEFKFNWIGFANAMGSNAFFTSRAAFTKKLISKDKNLNSQTIFLYVSAFTFLCSIAPSLHELSLRRVGSENKEGSGSAILDAESAVLLWKAVFSHYMYNILSFFLVVEVDSLTYSVGNSVKRLVTIYSAIIYFGNPVTYLNMFASFMAVVGVSLYSYDREKVRQAAEARKQTTPSPPV